MRINLASVLIDDQEKALRFYTDVLGFVKKTEFPVGEHRWLTVVSPEDADGVELALEPDEHPAAKPFKAALVEDGIPYTSFAVDDVHAEYERLDGTRGHLHPGAGRHGTDDDGGTRRHLRQPHHDHQHVAVGSAAARRRLARRPGPPRACARS